MTPVSIAPNPSTGVVTISAPVGAMISVVDQTGSIVGSMAGSLIVGAAQTWGAFYLSETAMVIIYAVMGAILIFRPWGLFGEEE